MTQLLKEKDLNKGVEIISRGGTVAFRTETVYGLGADATNDEAVGKVFAAKARPTSNPLIVHFYSLKHLREYVTIPDEMRRLFKIKSALTVVLPLSQPSKISPVALCGQDTIAVRIPSCKFARKFIRACGVPVAAPSANTSGRPSPTRWEDVQSDLDGKIDGIFMGKQTDIGVESTVVFYDGEKANILRRGGVSEDMIAKKTKMPICVAKDKESLDKSPGTRFKHYAPNVPLYILTEGKSVPVAAKFVVLCLTKNQSKYTTAKSVIALGDTAKEVQANLFAGLREAEKVLGDNPISAILIEQMPDTPEFASVNERIKKAVGLC